MTAQIPKSLRKPKETDSSLLSKSTRRNQFRLEAVTSEFFEPLDELLADKEWLISDTATSLDCLAVGYLALMQTPKLPHDWLGRALKEKYPRLGKWTARFGRSTFGAFTNPAHALSPLPKGSGKEARALPWRAPARPTITAIALSIADSTLDAVPIIGQLRTNNQLKKSSQDPGLEDYERKQLAVIATNRNRELFSQIFAVTAGISTFVGYLFWVGILQLPKGRSNGAARRDFGPAGTMLGLG